MLPGGVDDFVCWGSDQAGQLGDNGDEDRSLPTPIKPSQLPGGVSAGALHTCAVDQAARLWCWGRGSSGQLGPGHLVDTPFPIEVALPSGADQATAVASGDAHTCVLVSPDDGLGGEIFCFGDNSYGQLGDGTLTSRPTPALVSLGPTAVRATAVTAGGGHTCAIDVTGQPWCWGRGDSGQLGDGAGANQPTPTPVSLPGGATVRSLSAGGAHTCAVDQAGGVWCWGADDRGQLGLGVAGAGADMDAPAAVALPASATGVSAGGAHSCAEPRRRQRLVLGRERQRSARRRHHRRSPDARQGRRRQRGGERRGAAQLRLGRRPRRQLLGRRHQRTAGRRRHPHDQRPRAGARRLRLSAERIEERGPEC